MGENAFPETLTSDAGSFISEPLSKQGYRIRIRHLCWLQEDVTCESQDINVIFLDLKLFGMNGIELCRQIRTFKPVSLIYAMTGWSALYEIEEGREAGFDDFFTKPVSLEIIFKAVSDAFEKLNRWRVKSLSL